MVPPSSHGDSSCPAVLWILRLPSLISPTGLSPSLAGLPMPFDYDPFPSCSPKPEKYFYFPLASFAFAHHYLRNHVCFLFLRLLRWFSSAGSLAYDYFVHHTVIEYCSTGFPHSDIRGSMAICASPRLFAACHVLRRLLMPRHSPCALFRLTFSRIIGLHKNLLPTAFPKSQCSGRSLSLRYLASLPLFSISVALFLLSSSSSLYSVFKVRSLPLPEDLSIHRFPSECSDLSQLSVVGSSGLEPPTSRLSGARSNHLSYEPVPGTLVEMNRFELSTPCLQGRCSPI